MCYKMLKNKYLLFYVRMDRMNRKKLIALLLSSLMTAGAVASCSKPETDTPQVSAVTETVQTEPPATSGTEAAEDLKGYLELSVVPVSDEDDGKIMIFGHNSEFVSLAEKYAGITSDDYDFIEVNDSKDYQQKLDAVLSDGYGAPDIFTCDAAYARKYLASDDTIAVNDLGIDYTECSEMFDYTLRFASDDKGVIKGLAWKAAPCGVFYERSVAEEYLGTSDPDELASSFATWDAVMESARKVNEASEGTVKLIPGYTEIYDAFLTGRDNGWIMDGTVNIDPDIEGLFDYAKMLYTDDLTFSAEKWSDSWSEKMSDKTVVSYWGSLQFAKYQLALDPGEGIPVNPTSGDWGITKGPADYFSGGSWVMASKYCDKKAAAAEMIRAVCINEDNLNDMVGRGEFVNNIKLMTAAAADDKFAFDWLGGQNPYPVLLYSALNSDASLMTAGEDEYNRAFIAVVGAYCEGAFDTVNEAEDAFKEQVAGSGPG